MIQKLDLKGVRIEIDDKLRKYVNKSVSKLERYVPRHGRKSMHVEVTLTENKRQKNNQCTAEYVVYLPKGTLTAKESTINIYAAIDVTELKMQNQIKKYKEKHTDPKFFRRLTKRFKSKHVNQI